MRLSYLHPPYPSRKPRVGALTRADVCAAANSSINPRLSLKSHRNDTALRLGIPKPPSLRTIFRAAGARRLILSEEQRPRKAPEHNDMSNLRMDSMDVYEMLMRACTKCTSVQIPAGCMSDRLRVELAGVLLGQPGAQALLQRALQALSTHGAQMQVSPQVSTPQGMLPRQYPCTLPVRKKPQQRNERPTAGAIRMHAAAMPSHLLANGLCTFRV